MSSDSPLANQSEDALGYSFSLVGDTPPRSQPIRVLAVDDDPVSLRLLQAHLSSASYDVTIAGTPAKAVELAMADAPDIVIADWEMPEMDGLELCRVLRNTEVGRSMYFLLLTGHADDDLLVKAFDAGVDDFVSKPFLPHLLLARIKGGVRIARLQQQVQEDKEALLDQYSQLQKLTQQLRATTVTDSLTGLPNRRYAMKRLGREWSASERAGIPFSVAMIDVDDFKAVNDTCGHAVGDAVLREIGGIIKRALRASDEVCRLGGEEFLVFFPSSNEAECEVVAHRILKAVNSRRIQHLDFSGKVTVSVGIACCENDYDDTYALLQGADRAVYAAKHSGKNRVCRDPERFDSPDAA